MVGHWPDTRCWVRLTGGPRGRCVTVPVLLLAIDTTHLRNVVLVALSALPVCKKQLDMNSTADTACASPVAVGLGLGERRRVDTGIGGDAASPSQRPLLALPRRRRLSTRGPPRRSFEPGRRKWVNL